MQRTRRRFRPNRASGGSRVSPSRVVVGPVRAGFPSPREGYAKKVDLAYTEAHLLGAAMNSDVDVHEHSQSAKERAKKGDGVAPTMPLPTASVAEREKAGRYLRKHTPLKDQAVWRPGLRHYDPVDLLIENNRGRIENLVPIRYGRMLANPFAFLRGAAVVMAADLAHTPSTGLRLQACGDCHAVNFGGFATPERRIVFDINDFDETSPAPWEWDVKRLATSLVSVGRYRGFSPEDSRRCAWRAARSYRKHMARYAEMPILEAWYSRIDIEELIEESSETKTMRQWSKKSKSKTPAHQAAFAKL